MTDQPAERPESPETKGQSGSAAESGPYRVLARKYRPARFADLIGQEALVRTLTNAIESGRVAHAFILTGVRGVGKTTTARIIARALNCIGPDGTGNLTAEPCGQCEHCLAIAQDRHVDVIEMDAASRTGIDDIRELIESVRYRPVSARIKVYIIDEVHMLSRQAFNGLLKTLEEPPEHVVFVFATTEIRKVPVTVLSRCQRFDLRRVSQAELADHFAGIAARESVVADDAVLAMIARASDGSVRDGLSLLDQAIALAADQGSAGDGLRLEEARVKDMLGLADRTRIFDLFEAVMRGRPAEALAILGDLYDGGADPAVVLQDLLELTHFVTRLKLVPAIADDPATPEAERVRGGELAERLSLPVLARSWQILLKGLGETRAAPAPLQAAEMVLIRLIHASELPSPGELVARLQDGRQDALQAPPVAPGNGGSAPLRAEQATPEPLDEPAGAPPIEEEKSEPAPPAAVEPSTTSPTQEAHAPAPQSWAEIVALARARRESILANHLERDVHLVSFEPERIEIRPDDGAPRNLAGQLGRLLHDWTGTRWLVSVSSAEGAPTLRTQLDAEEARRREIALQDPLVQAVMDSFPGARLTARRDRPPADEPDQAAPRTENDDPPGTGRTSLQGDKAS